MYGKVRGEFRQEPRRPDSTLRTGDYYFAAANPGQPEDRNGARGFRFEATGTVEKLVTGAFPEFSQAMVSPRGLDCLQTPIDRWFPAARPRRAA